MLLLVVAGCGDVGSAGSTGNASLSTSTPASSGLATATASTGATAAPATATTQATPPLQHIFYIMMENQAYNQIIDNTTYAPYLSQLAASYGLATRYFGVTHPSLPNYLAAFSGSFQGIWDDCPAGANNTCAPQAFGSQLTSQEVNQAASTAHLFSSQNLVDQLEAHHLTWKAYMQSMPSIGFTGGYAGLYGQKHNPFLYFSDIQNNPARMQRIVPYTQFASDLKTGALPNFVWVTPDVCNDMHGAPECPGNNGLIARGDLFIHTLVGEIMSSSAWNQGAAIVITWDENETSSDGCCASPTGINGVTLGGGNVPLIVLTSRGPHHIVLSQRSYNHYSLLATIEHLWNLGCLANTCGMSQDELLMGLFLP